MDKLSYKEYSVLKKLLKNNCKHSQGIYNKYSKELGLLVFEHYTIDCDHQDKSFPYVALMPSDKGLEYIAQHKKKTKNFIYNTIILLVAVTTLIFTIASYFNTTPK